MNSYIKYQKNETQKYIDKYLKPYAEYINYDELNSLLNTIGLKLSKSYPDDKIHKYYNNLNSDYQYNAIQLNILDKNNIDCFNTNSKWYNKNIGNNKNYTSDYHRLREIKNNYYTLVNNYVGEL